MLRCSVCGDAFWPTGRWREDWCPGCWEFNFRASDELRLHQEASDQGAVGPTPRQAEAMRRMAARWFAAHEEED
jgi:hypothetical protein